MSIGSVKPAPLEAPPLPAGSRVATGDGAFPAIVSSIAAGDLTAARAAVQAAASTAPSGPSDAIESLARSLATGDLHAARRMLAQLGDATASKAAAEAAAPAGASGGTVPSALPTGLAVVDAGSVTPKASVDVHAVMVALATGNAGGIAADVINLYGPGGARYDPAAIMEAYRASALGQSQMADLSWIGKPTFTTQT